MKPFATLLAASMLPTAATAGFPPDPPHSFVVDVVPANPTTRHFVQLRVRESGCVSADLNTQVDAENRVVKLLVMGNDICSPSAYDVLLPVGHLAAGDWRIEEWGCSPGNWDDPELYCGPNLAADIPFTVVVGSDPRRIPTWSGSAALALTLMLVIYAGWRLRRIGVER